MRTPRRMPDGTIEDMQQMLAMARTAPELKRVQCILYRAKYGFEVQQIADMVGYSTGTVYNVQAAYLQHGRSAVQVRPRGGRHHCHLTREEEAALLASCAHASGEGGLLTLKQVHAAYEHAVGRPVAASTVYRMVRAHGWRTRAPRPRHPRADPQIIAAYKKTSRTSSRADVN